MSFFKKVTKTAKAVQSVGRWCAHPFCLHVAGVAKCRRPCCKV